MAMWQQSNAVSFPSSQAQVSQRPAELQDKKPVVAYMAMRLHEDGGFSVVASDHVKECANTNYTQLLKQQMLRAHTINTSPITSNDSTQDSKDTRKQQKPNRLRPGSIQAEHSTERLYSPTTEESMARYLDQRSTNGNFIYDTVLQPSSPRIDKTESEHVFERACRVKESRRFRIDDTPKVVDFLLSRLQRMQQNAVKRLAKAWIKGICPKKQAKFPYHEHTSVPQWWPAPDKCPFKEPDHIRKDHRLNLCLHLLRLRPEAGQLQEWNQDENMPHASHDLSAWTKFMQEIAPLDVVKDLRESEGLTERRMSYLKDIYKVAQMEEDYLNGDIDGTDQFCWDEDPEDKLVELRKLRRGISTRKQGSSTPRGTKRERKESTPYQSQDYVIIDEAGVLTKIKVESEDEQHPRKKPARRRNTQPKSKTKNASSGLQSDSLASSSRHMPIDCSAMSSYQDTPSATEPQTSYAGLWRHAEKLRGREDTPRDDMLTTSFSSTATSYCPPSTTDSFMADSSNLLPLAMGIQNSMHGLQFHDDMRSMVYPTHMVHNIPQPNFETVPNSPVMPHSSLLGLPMDHSATMAASQPHPWTMEGITSSQPMSLGGDLYSNPVYSMPPPQSFSAAMMMRSGSDSLSYADIYPRSNYTSGVTPSPTVTTTRHQAKQPSFSYDHISRPT